MHLDAVVEWDILSLILFQAEYMLENKLETWQEEEDPKTERATKKFQIYLEVKEKAPMCNKIKQELSCYYSTTGA